MDFVDGIVEFYVMLFVYANTDVALPVCSLNCHFIVWTAEDLWDEGLQAGSDVYEWTIVWVRWGSCENSASRDYISIDCRTDRYD